MIGFGYDFKCMRMSEGGENDSFVKLLYGPMRCIEGFEIPSSPLAVALASPRFDRTGFASEKC